MAEHLGDPTPDGVQHLLARADWDADAVRDDLLGYVAQHLGHPDGVLVVDETGFLKKGTKSCGVARQYSGTAGRIENCQVGVFLGYATTKGRALLDRALYLPKDWAGNADRRQEAGVPEGVGFATKIVQARQMIDRAVAAGVPARWVTADAVYGSDYHFHTTAEGHGLGYVAGVRADFTAFVGWRQVRAKALVAEVPADGWHRLSCGTGAKGPRVYDWAAVRTNAPEPDEYARGHVPGAVNIPVSRFPQELRRISAGRPVHVMCESGGRSSRVTAQLQQLGIDAVDVAGGTAAWRWAGHALDAA